MRTIYFSLLSHQGDIFSLWEKEKAGSHHVQAGQSDRFGWYLAAVVSFSHKEPGALRAAALRLCF